LIDCEKNKNKDINRMAIEKQNNKDLGSEAKMETIDWLASQVSDVEEERKLNERLASRTGELEEIKALEKKIENL